MRLPLSVTTAKLLTQCSILQTFALHDKELRRQIRKTLYDGVCANELATRESILMTYQGFQIVLPTNMTKEKPYVWLQRRGRYYVELGDSEVGCLIRLDNALQGLPDHLKKLEQGLADMHSKELALHAELQKGEDFTARITACKEKLEKIDKKLGVDK